MKEISFSFQVKIPLKRRDVHWIEVELLKIREEVFLEILKRILERIEEERLQEGRRCSRCGGKLIRYGRQVKKIRTLVGSVKIARVRLHCCECGQDSYPMDKAIGLEGKEGTTLGVRERALWAAVELSYEKTASFLKKFTGLEVSRQKIYNMAIEEGQRIEAWENRRCEEVFGQGKRIEKEPEKIPKVLFVQVDATGMNDRGSREWMECKVGTSFSGRAKVSKNRYWLLDKRSYASVEEVGAFGEKFYLECLGQGVMEAEKVYFISDGASWIRNLKNNYFPEAIGVLDIWHLEREFKQVLGEENQELVESLKELALRGKGQEILKRLMKESEDPEKEEKIAKLANYVVNNLEWIENIAEVAGYGSGPVEKTVDIVVARRFKKRGMSWLRQYANPLLKLRLLKLNGDWETYWNERQEQLAQYAN